MKYFKTLIKWIAYGIVALFACSIVLIVVVNLTGNNAPETAKAPEVTITPGPSPTVGPTDTPLPTRPALATATLTPDLEKVYRQAALEIGEAYADSFAEMEVHMAGVSTFDDMSGNDLTALKEELETYHRLAERVRNLIPPPEYEDLQEDFVKLATDLEEMATLMARGFEQRNMDDLNRANRLLQRAVTRLGNIDRHMPDN